MPAAQKQVYVKGRAEQLQASATWIPSMSEAHRCIGCHRNPPEMCGDWMCAVRLLTRMANDNGCSCRAHLVGDDGPDVAMLCGQREAAGCASADALRQSIDRCDPYAWVAYADVIAITVQAAEDAGIRSQLLAGLLKTLDDVKTCIEGIVKVSGALPGDDSEEGESTVMSIALVERCKSKTSQAYQAVLFAKGDGTTTWLEKELSLRGYAPLVDLVHVQHPADIQALRGQFLKDLPVVLLMSSCSRALDRITWLKGTGTMRHM